jgi:hypothetical protein
LESAKNQEAVLAGLEEKNTRKKTELDNVVYQLKLPTSLAEQKRVEDKLKTINHDTLQALNKAIAIERAKDEQGDEEKAHLKRHEKYTVMGSPGKEKYNLVAELRKSAKSYDVTRLQEEAQRTAKEDMESLLTQSNAQNKKGSVKLIPETHHGEQHGKNIDQLIGQINSGELGSDSEICIERKQDGANLGMADVIMIADAIKHNEAHHEDLVELPQGIEKSLIYKDAELYNAARDKGIRVIGVEGKGLEHSKESPLYTKAREEHMAEVVAQMASTGKNVVLVVGDAHKERLESLLLEQGIGVEVVERDGTQDMEDRLAGKNNEVILEATRNMSSFVTNAPRKNTGKQAEIKGPRGATGRGI